MYLIFDTETTGLPKNFDAPHTDLENWPRLVQIAWQLHGEKGELLSQNNLIVKPEGFTIPFNAEKVHGISTEIALEEGKPLAEVLKVFAEDIAKSELLIGHNIKFDLNIMGAEMLRANVESLLWEKTPYDTSSEETAKFVGIKGGRGGKFKWPSLTELHTKLFGEAFDDAHDAAYDVAATARSFFGLIENKIAKPLGNVPFEQIHYEAPKLDDANFAKKRERKGIQIPAKFRGTLDRFIPYNHLHVHTQFSILQSTVDIKSLMKRAKDLGMEAIGITDLGNMHAAFNAVGAGVGEEIKVIMGCEVYVAEERLKKQFTKNNPDRRFLQVLLATNQEAYHRLSRLVSLGYAEGYYAGVPRVDKQLIQEHSEGLIALTGDLKGEIPSLILNKGEHEAEEAFKWWLDVFGENFYVELQRHGLPEEARINEILLKFADKYDVKPVATHSTFYINQEDHDAHDTLACVKTGDKKDTPKIFDLDLTSRRYRFGMPNEEFYFKTPEEMNDLFSDVPVALENVQEIIDKCSPIKLKRDVLMPNFTMPSEFESQDDYLKYLSFEGAKKHYGKITTEVQERLDMELEIIKNMGFPGYFLIVQDFINEARKRGVFVGPGRGCLSKDAPVVLKNGETKNIKNIEIGDEVITIDGTSQKVKNTFRYEVQEELLNIKTYYGENIGITLTKDHKVFAEKQKRPKNYNPNSKTWRKLPEIEGKPKWMPAENIEVGDWLFVPKIKLKTKSIKFFDLAQFSNNHELHHDANYVYHDALNPVGKPIYSRMKKVKRYIHLDEDWYTIFGLFVGDGWVRSDERPVVSFIFDKKQKKLQDFFFQKINSQELDFSIHENKSVIVVDVRNKQFYFLFKQLFPDYKFSADTKSIPDFVMKAKKKNVFAFLKGYNWADGTETKYKFRYTTTSRKLADQVRFLCWRLGIPASLGSEERGKREIWKGSGEYFKKLKKAYYVTIPKDSRIGEKQAKKNYFYKKIPEGFLVKVREINTVQDEKYVYDFEVENHHNYLTSSFLVHNSAAGSAVAYCIGITNIDPIKYDLLFERFLNPERISMPDIDIDFDDEGRQEVIDYVVEKYGKNQVAQIITYGTMAAKSAIKDVARVLDLPLADANAMAKLVPEKPGTKLKNAVKEVTELKQILAGDAERNMKTKILKQALVLEGSVRNTGIHAAGVIIAPDDITKYIPVCTSKDADLLVTQFDGRVVEDAGMLKMDFLGLKTLTIIKDALKLIKKNHNKEIDIDEIPLDDANTFALYQKGDTIGTFQFESEGMQMYLRDLKPTNIEDLVAMNSLYRPGPLQFIPNYIKRKHGQEVIEYPHDLLEPILKNTNGIMVYQEQIMQTAQILAGYTLGGADLLRRAMGKKKIAEMDRQEVIFIKGAKEKHDIPEEKSRKVFEIMKEFAKYGFNRSHSAAYSVLAYQTAYLKANYKPEYMASVLTHNMNSIEKITFFIEECNKQGIAVLGPDINESEATFTVNKEGQIRFGLAAIKGTGEAAIATIIEEKKENGNFKDIFDFSKRINLRTVNKKSFESLAQAGAFDSFKIKRSQYFVSAEGENDTFIGKLIRYGNAVQKEAEEGGSSLFGEAGAVEIANPKIPECSPWAKLELLKREKEIVGFYISGHPLEQYKSAVKQFCNTNIQQVNNIRSNMDNLIFAGIITQAVTKQSRNGRMFTSFNIEDLTGIMNLALFGEDHITYSEIVKEGNIVLIKGKVQSDFNDKSKFNFRTKDIQTLEDLSNNQCKGIMLKISLEENKNFDLQKLDIVFQNFKGEYPVYITFKETLSNVESLVKIGKYQVKAEESLLQELKNLQVEGNFIY